jgi:hypothetical protein
LAYNFQKRTVPPTTSLHPFPEPINISGRLFWRKGQIRAWLAEVAREPAPQPRDDDDALMSSRTMRTQFLDGISEMSLWRWRHPKPSASEAA